MNSSIGTAKEVGIIHEKDGRYWIQAREEHEQRGDYHGLQEGEFLAHEVSDQ